MNVQGFAPTRERAVPAAARTVDPPAVRDPFPRGDESSFARPHRPSPYGPRGAARGSVGRYRRRGRHRSAVSTIIATMLLLAITVILFSAVFFFIGKFPKPGPQPLDQFDASLAYSGINVSTITILHLTGTALSGSTTSQAAVYILSQRHPTAIPNPFTLAAGLGGSTIWSLGQNWSISLMAYGITAPDNLTVSVVSAGQLQFRSSLAVSIGSFAPYFNSVQAAPSGVIPAAHKFYVNATAVFATASGDKVTLNTSELPGGSVVTLVGSGSGLFTYSGTTPNPASQTTYFLFLTAIDANNVRTVLAMSITVA
ncbi:MAG TPA: type IV pilin N-terminal domain-containing protein [Thermoplasmata archaeon]|nr:type IV pilin N-terminal domain-containing protein [Thermoplasmata archaeon]